MRKSTKGALAAGTAAVLLLGGAGSLAYWTDNATVAGDSLTSGSIDLTAVTCGAWAYGGVDAGTPATPVTAIVPGDQIVKQCTGTLTLVGDHIGATVSLDAASWAAANPLTAELLTPTATMTSPAATISNPGTYPVTIDVTVSFPYGGPVSAPDATTGAENGSQVQTATLNDLELVAVQTHDGAGVTP